MSTEQDELLENFITSLKRRMQREYDRNVNKDLSKQNAQDIFIRNVLLVMQLSLNEAAEQLKQPYLKQPSNLLEQLKSWPDELVQYALQKHRTSCAISNFSEEHKPSQDYIAQTLTELEKVWQQFSEKVLKTH